MIEQQIKMGVRVEQQDTSVRQPLVGPAVSWQNVVMTIPNAAELDRRADELDAGQTNGLTWREAADQILDRRA